MIIDKTGMRFGRLTALRIVGKDKYGRSIWLCKCDCGVQKEICTAKLLVSGQGTKSCGCLLKEGGIRTHGMTGEKIYDVWYEMIKRCHKPYSPSFPRYGKRGIRVCEEWRKSFESFYNHVSSLDHFSEAGYSLDRIDNEGDYMPGNVKWSTRSEQSRNTRQNRNLSYGGKTMCLKDWAAHLGLSESTIRRRLKIGWSVEEALTMKKHTIKHGVREGTR